MAKQQLAATSEHMHDNHHVPYGFEHVSADEKTHRVRDLFSRVSRRYDVMNDVMSLGVHRAWKDHFVAMMRPRAGQQFLDLASGTGDIASRIIKQLKPSVPEATTQIILSDLNPDMLNEAKARWLDAGYGFAPHVKTDFLVASAEDLPFDDASFDHITISFGMRNVARPTQALAEIYRLLKLGGRFSCLEFAPDVDSWMKSIYQAYLTHLIPQMGRLIADDEAAYRYLAESIQSYIPSAHFALMMQDVGFKHVGVERLCGGVVAIHHGYRV